jgi:hypothetical protein
MTDRNKSHNKIELAVIRDIDSLEPFADAWNRLASRAPQKIPMLSHAYIITYFEHFLEPDESWFCIMALRGEELLGVLPATITPARYAGVERPLLRAPFNMHIASVDFLVSEEMDHQVVSLLLNGLKKESAKYFALELRRIPASSPTISALAGRVPGSTVIKEFNGRGSFIDTMGSFEEYQAGLKHNFRRNLTKARNKISKLPDLKTVFLSGEDADPDEIDTLMKVEAAGWKGRAGTAIISSNTTQAFYSDLARRLAKLGWLEWHILYTDDRPIAMHLAMKIDRTLVINKIGFDEEFSRCAPGNILFEQTVRRAFESDDTDEIDCITDMSWHDNWQVIKKDFYDLWIYPNRPISLICGVLPKKIKDLGRRVPAVKSLYKWIRSMVKGA